ncbi:hypothetical protein PVK06_034849 [Gossypium arboreum]|uniref:RNase H type-1 domain-containing protein n=1 Tax=Gossypium arboreum TaxID=29729 RepID=A0ABR0NHJ2_GOSAR|nr:hypothetical protein PVK06_034849 [Gossypium arboreum]
MERDTGKATAGDVVRDMNGNWILGFNHYLGNCTPFELELWGVLDEILIMLKKLIQTGHNADRQFGTS